VNSGTTGRADDKDDASDQQKKDASNNASNSAKVGGTDVGEEEASVGSTAVEESGPPPPPSREPVGRTQMNARVRVDRMRALKKYQHEHRATLQAVVDQMVDEYLERRGLLPPE
jgi:hypothetical protein